MARTGSTKPKYPKFVIFELKDNGPLVTVFETSKEVADFLWGKYLPRIAIFKDRELVYLESADVDAIRKELDEAHQDD